MYKVCKHNFFICQPDMYLLGGTQLVKLAYYLMYALYALGTALFQRPNNRQPKYLWKILLLFILMLIFFLPISLF
jgi:hypothetical protein